MEVKKSISKTKTKKNTHNHSKIKTHKNKTYHSLKYMNFEAFEKSKINNDNTKIIKFLESNPTKLQINKLYQATLYFIDMYFSSDVGIDWPHNGDSILNKKRFNFRLLFIMNMDIINKIIKETWDEENLYIETYIKKKYKRLKPWRINNKISELKRNKEYPEYDKLFFEKLKKTNIFESHTNIITKNNINSILELGKNNYEYLQKFWISPQDYLDKSIITAYNLLNHLHII